MRWPNCLALLLPFLSLAVVSEAQEPPSFTQELQSKIDKDTENWIRDASTLLKRSVSVPGEERTFFRDKFLTKVREFATDPSRLVRYGEGAYTTEARSLILQRKILESGRENVFWIQTAYWRGLADTGETVRNLYFSMLLETIRWEGLKPSIVVRPRDRVVLFDCDSPPYSKWYCEH